MISYEKTYWQQNKQHIAGIDEVGRGCLLGDVVAAAVILPIDLEIEGINDSKKLSPKKREVYYEIIMEKALAVGIGIMDAGTIDNINIKQATRLAMAQAVENLEIQPDYLFIDAEKISSPIPQLSLIKGDQLSQSIAAASIVAKVTRDRMCMQWDMEYPEYDIAKHKGYGTKLHREHISNYGACPIHRRTFLKNIMNIQQTLF